MLQQQAQWLLVVEIIYLLLLVFTCLRIVYDTNSISKTISYLLFAVFVPVVGIAFYFSFGINYRKRKIYDKKLNVDEKFKKEVQAMFQANDLEEVIHKEKNLLKVGRLVRLLANKKVGRAFLFPNNEARLLHNGEEKFPLLLEDLRQAQHHIHIEYYIYDNDEIGNTIKNILIEKAKQGVSVRLIYDDFGSKNIRRNIVRELKKNGVEAYPFNKVRLLFLANRLNYRNHRKIVVIDGTTAYTGGINISDKYINNGRYEIYWRDAHLRIRGPASFALQQVFISDWNFCSKKDLPIKGKDFFPFNRLEAYGNAKMQVISSGPDSDLPNILYATLQAISTAETEILLTTPYYIPDESLQQSLIMAALSGIDVKLLVPEASDSKIVTIVSRAYYEELLQAGVKVYLYQKGFIHAKTFVVDRKIASVGTANLDLRSFDLNFEVSTLIYDVKIAEQLSDAFYADLTHAKLVQHNKWIKRSIWERGWERFLRLISPFM